MKDAHELELKLGCTSATATALRQHLAQFCGKPPLILDLGNIYYDTPDARLAGNAIALRIRTQGQQQLQTVKCAGTTQGGMSSRPEWEVPYAGRFDFSNISDPAVQQQLVQCSDRLVPVLSTHFKRYQWAWHDTKASIAFMLDQGEVRAGNACSPLCELELELIKGSPEALLDLAETLCQRHPLFISPLSKAARGNRLRGTKPPPAQGLTQLFHAFCEALPANRADSSNADCEAHLAALKPALPAASRAELAALEQTLPPASRFSHPQLGLWLLRQSRHLSETEGTCI